ncbi:nitroreductase family protein [Paraburkholderia caledonica]|uniref:SagB-type dehydrogenase family enzyme n=1 Tax=Paraburkholderia caledonica TaxID=134536 RepID=A0AB73IJ04_9BURK|nr:SagB-type dehydrogenase family enzyme [Paraburkholderia caledonica]
MTWMDLGNPALRTEPGFYTPVSWAEGPAIALDEPSEDSTGSTDTFASHTEGNTTDLSDGFDALVASRRTRYDFHGIDLPSLGQLFSLTCRVSLIGTSALGFPLSQRPAPSAGAIHPVHVVVHLPGAARLHRYDPFGHGLRPLTCHIRLTQLRDAMNCVVDGRNAALLMFVAEPGKTLAKYEAGCSLIWRDAGILQGYFSMAAESLGLNFVPLGVTGDPWAGQLVEQAGLTGVGVAYVGTRARAGAGNG